MKTKMHIRIYSLLLLFAIGVNTLWAVESPKEKEEELNVQEIIFEHIGDAYEWHITTWGNTEISIPLPIIVYSSETGWHSFLSSRLEHGSEYEGFQIAAEGKYKGKVVEVKADGSAVRPFDISLTKVAVSLIISSILLVVVILGVSHWYKNRRPEEEAPRRFVGFMEMFVMVIYDGVVKSCVGKDYERYAPYLLTVFFFIFFNNIMGLIPLFPGGANVTGNIAVTLFLSVCTFIAINVFASKEYWKEILWPDVPLWLKVPIPLMPAIELFSVITKPFALTIRLFANIMAGHSVILALTCIIFVTAKMGIQVNAPMTVVSVCFAIFMNCMELLVAFIQAYVFTVLSAVFIGLSRVEKEEPKAKIENI